MPVLLPNCLISTSRSLYSATSGTSAMADGTPVLVQEPGNAKIITINDYHTLPQAALQCEFMVKVAKSSDVAPGDIVTAIQELDGVTPWFPFDPDFSAEYFSVALVLPTSPRLLEALIVYIMRQTIGGVAR